MEQEFLEPSSSPSTALIVLFISVIAFIAYKYLNGKSSGIPVRAGTSNALSIEEARRRMQERLDKAAEEAKKRKEEEAARKSENPASNSSSHISRLSPTLEDEARPIRRRIIPPSERLLRPNDYNPLLGSSGSGGYRPSPRSCGPAKGG